MKKDTNKKKLQVWDNSNIGESFPGMVLPLTFSISRRGYELVYKSQAYEAGLDWYGLEANHRTFSAMVGLFAGRMYYNLANWYKFIGLFPNNARNQKYLDEQLSTIGETVYLPPSSYPLTYKLKFFFRISRRIILFELEKKRYWRYLENSYKDYESLSSGKDLESLLDKYAFIEQNIIPHMGRSADNDFFVMTYHGILKNKLRKWLGKNNSRAIDFLGSLHDVISARQAALLSSIAMSIDDDSKAEEFLKNEEYEKLDKHLMATGAGKLISEYRSKFLHRFAQDQKIEAINPMLPLSGFYGLISTYRQLDNKSIVKKRQKMLKTETQKNRKILKQLNLPRKVVYKFLLWRLKHHLRIREHNRLFRGKAYAYLRELFIHIGNVMEKDGLIDAAEDVHYLDIEEIFGLIDGTGYMDDLKHIVRSRKNRYEEYNKLKAPVRFVTYGPIINIPEKFFKKGSIQSEKQKKILRGDTASAGNIEGRVVVLEKPTIPKEPFEILVVSHTDPGWTPLIALAKGLVVEHGGMLSHAAIVTRELGIPSIIGVKNATRHLKTGAKVRLNSAKGTVEIIRP